MRGKKLREQVSRRSVLKGIAGGGLGAGLGLHQAAEFIDRNQAMIDMAVLDLQMQGLLPRGKGVSKAIDTSRDGNTDVEIRRADAGGRTDVVQVTSSGTMTADYAISLANIQPRNLTLGDLTDDATYQYREGDENTSAVPDEVWLVIKGNGSNGRGSNGSGSNGKGSNGRGPNGKGAKSGGRQYVCRTETDADASGWNTRAVHREIEGDFDGAPNPGSGQQWKQFDKSTRELTRIGDDLIASYGADADVQAIGIGRGTTTTGESKLNTYYDDLRVAGESLEFPL